MNHQHTFQDIANVRKGGERKMVTEKRCEDSIATAPKVSLASGRITQETKPCTAVKETIYKIRSVTDTHNEHPATPSTIRLFGDSTPDYAKHVNSFDEVPDWVRTAIEHAMGQVEIRSPGMFMTSLKGPEISMHIATSETEYNVTFNKVDERIVVE